MPPPPKKKMSVDCWVDLKKKFEASKEINLAIKYPWTYLVSNISTVGVSQ